MKKISYISTVLLVCSFTFSWTASSGWLARPSAFTYTEEHEILVINGFTAPQCPPISTLSRIKIEDYVDSLAEFEEKTRKKLGTTITTEQLKDADKEFKKRYSPESYAYFKQYCNERLEKPVRFHQKKIRKTNSPTRPTSPDEMVTISLSSSPDKLNTPYTLEYCSDDSSSENSSEDNFDDILGNDGNSFNSESKEKYHATQVEIKKQVQAWINLIKDDTAPFDKKFLTELVTNSLAYSKDSYSHESFESLKEQTYKELAKL